MLKIKYLIDMQLRCMNVVFVYHRTALAYSFRAFVSVSLVNGSCL